MKSSVESRQALVLCKLLLLSRNMLEPVSELNCIIYVAINNNNIDITISMIFIVCC